MPDYYLFHQNMRVFGGDSAERNANFGDALMTISGRLGAGRVAAAGFTEVTNAGAASDALGLLAAHLDAGLAAPALFATGVTVFKSEAPEYVAISVNETFGVKARGRVLLVGQASGEPQWTCLSDADVPIGVMPDNVAPDSRGLAYACGELGGKKLVVGFMHNMDSLGDGSSVLGSLASMMRSVWEKHADYGGVATFLGGDFNVAPLADGGAARAVYACDDENRPVSTTRGRAYDFWVVSKQITNDHASAYADTRDEVGGLSDHGGIALRLPLEQM